MIYIIKILIDHHPLVNPASILMYLRRSSPKSSAELVSHFRVSCNVNVELATNFVLVLKWGSRKEGVAGMVELTWMGKFGL